MSRKGGAEKVDLPCYSVAKPKGLELQFAASDQEYTFIVEHSKWPFPDPLRIAIPVNEKTLTGTDAKLEISRLSNPRVEEYLIKGPDPRAVRYAGDLLEDLFRSAAASHRFEFAQIERSGSSEYLVHLSRPQRDGRCLSTLLNEARMNALLTAFEVKTAKVIEKGLSGWITSGEISEDWLRSVRGKLSESDRLKLDWKKKMRGEKTEEEALKEQWQRKMRGESTEQRASLPSNPLDAVDLRTRTSFLRHFGSTSNTAAMDSLTFLLHNAGVELEAYEPQAPPYRIRTLASSKDKSRRLLVWTEHEVRIMSEAKMREKLFGEKATSARRSKKDKARESKEKDRSSRGDSKEKKSGKKHDARPRKDK